MKSIALQMPIETVAERLDSPLRGLVANLCRSLKDLSEGPLELSETERVVRQAEALRAAFMGSTARDR